MARQFRERWIAGAYIQQTGTNAPSSLTGLNTSSQQSARDVQVTNNASLAHIQANSLTGGAGYRGIATVNSGTTVASVAATAAISGAVIQTTIIQYASGVSSQAMVNTYVESVRAGAFEIRTVGSVAPVGNMPVAWFIIR